MREVTLYSETPERNLCDRVAPYRGNSRIRKRTPLGPYRRPVPRVLGESYGGGRFLIGQVPL